MSSILFGVLLLACVAPLCVVVSGREPDAAPIPDNPLANTAAPVPDNEMADTVAKSRRESVRQWQEAKFGLFLHWGVYSVYGGSYKGEALWSAEWIQENARIPWEEYSRTAAEWNPSRFNADSWVLAAKSAGMRYIVITAKHHDGFAMYPSAASRYNLMNWTKYRGPDPLRALQESCRRHGLLFGIYYSPLEFRTSPAGFGRKEDDEAIAKGFRYVTLGPKPYASNADVVALAKAQIRELAEWYRPDVLWFDGTWDRMGVWTKEDAEEAAASIRAVCPDVVINNRLGASADFNTYEGELPREAPAGIWEYCWNLGCFWGYNPRNYEPQIVGTPEQYIETLVQTASLGGNYLLNVGPMPTGELPPMAVDYLKRIGVWANAHGECIYGVEKSPFGSKPDWGYVTTRASTLYLIVKDWAAKIELPAVAGRRPVKAYRLGDREKKGIPVVVAGDQWAVMPAGPKPAEPFAVVAIELGESL